MEIKDYRSIKIQKFFEIPLRKAGLTNFASQSSLNPFMLKLTLLTISHCEVNMMNMSRCWDEKCVELVVVALLVWELALVLEFLHVDHTD